MRLNQATLIVMMYSMGTAVLLILWVVGRLKHFQWNATELSSTVLHTSQLTSHWRDEEKKELEKEFILATTQLFSKASVGTMCEVPSGGFKAWGQGVVTKLAPQVDVNCSKILSGDEVEIQRVHENISKWKNALSDEDVLKKIQNCTWSSEYFSNNLYNSDLEKSFPIAFSLIVYDSPQQVLRLLRFLYRPQNAYCIHYDIKSKHKEFFEHIARCFDNVIIASRLVTVVWGYYTIMQAQMNCMEDLLEYRNKQVDYKWKYLINLCGKELPLVTNRDIVAKLMRLNGSSSVVTESCATRKNIIKRIEHPVELNSDATGIIVHDGIWLENRPFNLTLFHKSSSYNALSFQFANYIASNQTAKIMYDFFKQTKNTEEHFYATLYRTPGIPGGFDKRIPKSYYFKVAGSFWSKLNTFQRLKKHDCRGKVIHEVCVVGPGDLPAVVREGSLFHNKYFEEFDHSVMTCMEERLVQMNKLEYQKECG